MSYTKVDCCHLNPDAKRLTALHELKCNDFIYGKFKAQLVHPHSLIGKYCESSDNLCSCLKIGSRSFVNVTEFENFRMTGTVQIVFINKLRMSSFGIAAMQFRIFCLPFHNLEA
jgi:hypothetical protein